VYRRGYSEHIKDAVIAPLMYELCKDKHFLIDPTFCFFFRSLVAIAYWDFDMLLAAVNANKLSLPLVDRVFGVFRLNRFAQEVRHKLELYERFVTVSLCLERTDLMKVRGDTRTVLNKNIADFAGVPYGKKLGRIRDAFGWGNGGIGYC